MEEEFETPKVNFVPCIKILRQGISKSNPTRIQLTRAELVKLNSEIRKGSKDLEKNEGETDLKNAANEDDEYNMDHYNDNDETSIKLSDIAVLEDDDPYESFSNDLPDSDEEDDIIKQTDNLILVGHVEGNTPILEVYVYNEKEDSFYVHHDYLLPRIPLAIEWLNHDPSNTNEPGNLCAIGYVTPIIGVWDLDIVNCIEPAFKLGKKGNVKTGTSRVGHKKAVLDLSWNSNYYHILASGSVDKTLILWDLDKAEPSTTISCFEGAVQTMNWHPTEGYTLLTGAGDKMCRVFDCRTTNTYNSWTVKGEVEKVIWNPFNEIQFVAADDQGFIYGFDYRQKKKFWEIQAHSQEVTGIATSSSCPGLLCTVSRDEYLKIWDILNTKPILVLEKNLKIGGIHCIDSAPDLPFIMASGGDNRNKNLIVFDAVKKPEVKEVFQNRIPNSDSCSYENITKKVKKKKSKVEDADET